jgi:argininosuccinate lyase
MLDSVQTVSDSLGIANGVIATLKVRPERMEAYFGQNDASH